MTTKKTSTPKQQPAKKGAKPPKKAAAKKSKPVQPADIAAIETTQPVGTPAAADAQQASMETAHAESVSNGKPQTGDGQAITKRTRKASKPQADEPHKFSAIDAAAKVLAEAGKPMNCKEMIEAMATRGYWTSPGGLTPDATLYSSIAREIKLKGTASRFKKADRGQFALNAAS